MLRKIGKLVTKICVFLVGLATILSLLIALIGRNELYQYIINAFDVVFGIRILLLLSILIVAISLSVASFICIKAILYIQKKLTSEYENNDKKLKEIRNLLSDEKNLGILNIGLRGKPGFASDDFKTILQSTTKELIISGHSLNKTVNKKNDDVRCEFMNTVIRLVEKDCSVKILLSKINGSEELEKKRYIFDAFVKEVYDKLKAKKVSNEFIQRNFLIKEANILPYYIIKSENKLHIGHYTFGEYNTNEKKLVCFVMEVNPNIGYGEYYYKDFISFFNSEEADFIDDYRELFKSVKDE